MRASNGESRRFTHIQLKNWKNFLRVEVSLGRRAYLAGPCASGKTSFLDLFRFLHDLVAPGEGFQAAIRKRGGLRKLRCLAARHDSDVGFLVHVGTNADPALWEYELHFTQDDHPSPVIRRERAVRGGVELFSRPDEKDAAEPERLEYTLLEQEAGRGKLAELASFFRSVRYWNLAPQLVREPERAAMHNYDAYGGTLLDQMAAVPERTGASRLRAILEALHPAIPRMEELEVRRDGRGRPHLRVRHEHWRSRGAVQTEQQLPDGALRLIGLLWTALDATGPVLAEEPETSLDPRLARLVPGMLARIEHRSDQQMLVTTHSPDLLESADVRISEVFLLVPGEEATAVRPALGVPETRTLLENGPAGWDPPPPSDEDDAERQIGLFEAPGT